MRQRSQAVMSMLAAGILSLVPAGSGIASRQATPDKGLYITPLRQYITVDAGQSSTGVLTVADYTNHPITVLLTAEHFSVVNYTYNYQFAPAQHDSWVRLSVGQLQLQPFKSQQVHYTVTAPANATPGGHYFALIANTTLGSGAVKSNVQAASILYTTVKGPLDYSSSMRHNSLPLLAFGPTIPYQFDVSSSGNTHFFVYVWGQLHGWTAAAAEPLAAHILMPRTTRTIGGSITAPILPGVYRATYGYKTDAGAIIERTGYVVYLPPWSVLTPLGVGIIIFSVVRHRRRATGS